MNPLHTNIYQLPESSHSSNTRPKLSLPSGIFSAPANSTATNASCSANFVAKALNTDISKISTNSTGNLPTSSSTDSVNPALNQSSSTLKLPSVSTEHDHPMPIEAPVPYFLQNSNSNKKLDTLSKLGSLSIGEQPAPVPSNSAHSLPLKMNTNFSGTAGSQVTAPNNNYNSANNSNITTTNNNTTSTIGEPTHSENQRQSSVSGKSSTDSSYSLLLKTPEQAVASAPETRSPNSHKTSSSIGSKPTSSPLSDQGSFDANYTARSPISSISSHSTGSINVEPPALSMSIPVSHSLPSTIIPPANILPLQSSISSSSSNIIPPPSIIPPSNLNQASSNALMPPLPPFPFPVKKSTSKSQLSSLSIPPNPNVQQKNYLPDPTSYLNISQPGNSNTSTTPSLSLRSADSLHSHSSSDSSGVHTSSFLEPASAASSNNTNFGLSASTPLSRLSPSSVSTGEVHCLETTDGGFRTDSTIVPPRSSTSEYPDNNCNIGDIGSVGNIGSIGGPGSIAPPQTKLSLNTGLSINTGAQQSGFIKSTSDLDTRTLTKDISAMNIEQYTNYQQDDNNSTTTSYTSAAYVSQVEYASDGQHQEAISHVYGSANSQSIESSSSFTSSYSSAPKLRPSNYEKYAELDVQDLDEEGWRSVAAAGDIEELGRLGEGAGGSVTRCRLRGRNGKNGHGSVFALKAITTNPNPEVQKQILRELQFNRSCNSAHIVKYYGTFLSEETASIFIAMEYCGGGSLEAIYKRVKVRGGRIGEKVLGKVAEGVLSGLSYLHERHIIHRDIKPQNILLDSEGQVKLCDFGVSGEVVNSLATTFTGTSYYMAPERIQGQPYTVTSDVWSLGLTIMEVAQHRFPFLPENHEPLMPIELLSVIVNMPAPELKDEPEEGIKWSASFRHFLKSCLEKDPKKRASPRQMLGHPWIVGQRNKTVKMAKFVKECWS